MELWLTFLQPWHKISFIWCLTLVFFHLLTCMHRTFSSSHLHFSQYSQLHYSVPTGLFFIETQLLHGKAANTSPPSDTPQASPPAQDQKDSLVNLNWHPCLGGVESKYIFSGQRLSLSPHGNHFGFRSCYEILPLSEKLTEHLAQSVGVNHLFHANKNQEGIPKIKGV